jgi:hypothetical protein
VSVLEEFKDLHITHINKGVLEVWMEWWANLSNTVVDITRKELPGYKSSFDGLSTHYAGTTGVRSH